MAEGNDVELAYTVGEAAAAIGISKNAIYALIGSRRIPFVKFGRTIRIPRSELASWFDERAREHTEMEIDR